MAPSGAPGNSRRSNEHLPTDGGCARGHHDRCIDSGAGLRHRTRGGRIGRRPAHRQRPAGRPGDRRRPGRRGRAPRGSPVPTTRSRATARPASSPLRSPDSRRPGRQQRSSPPATRRSSTRRTTAGAREPTDSGPNVRGDTDYDVAILRIDLNVPAGVNCLSSFDFRYLSEEYPEFVNTTSTTPSSPSSTPTSRGRPTIPTSSPPTTSPSTPPTVRSRSTPPA